MPLYTWEDKSSGKIVEILRNFDEYKDPPNSTEIVDSGLTEEEAAKAVWVKQIGKNIQVTRGANWNGSKGNW